jgi:sulfur carrier protein ThiS
MLCVRLIPKGEVKCFEEDEIAVSTILERIRDMLDESAGVIVVVNGKPVDNLHYIVKKDDEVVVAQEFMGG